METAEYSQEFMCRFTNSVLSRADEIVLTEETSPRKCPTEMRTFLRYPGNGMVEQKKMRKGIQNVDFYEAAKKKPTSWIHFAKAHFIYS